MLKKWPEILAVLAALVILALALAWISAPFGDFNGWLSFFLVLSLSAALLYWAWKLVALESPPRWLLFLLIAAAVLRLAAFCNALRSPIQTT